MRHAQPDPERSDNKFFARNGSTMPRAHLCSREYFHRRTVFAE